VAEELRDLHCSCSRCLQEFYRRFLHHVGMILWKLCLVQTPRHVLSDVPC
jgi:hypothetical protein